MLLKWLGWIYGDVKEFYTFYHMLIVIGIGLFTFFVSQNSLKQKKLKKEANLAKIIGLTYLIGGFGLFILFKIF